MGSVDSNNNNSNNTLFMSLEGEASIAKFSVLHYVRGYAVIIRIFSLLLSKWYLYLLYCELRTSGDLGRDWAQKSTR